MAFTGEVHKMRERGAREEHHSREMTQKFEEIMKVSGWDMNDKFHLYQCS